MIRTEDTIHSVGAITTDTAINSYSASAASYYARKSRTTAGSTDFVVYKPIVVVLRATGTEFTATLNYLWNSVVSQIIAVSSDGTTTAMASINPGYYRFSTAAGGGVNNPNAYLEVIGVYGSTDGSTIWA